jgi:hypothetical protein
VRYPTRALLRFLRENPPEVDFWLDDLSPENAWQLAVFLNQFMTAIWTDYGRDIVDYQTYRIVPTGEPPLCDIRPQRSRARQGEDIQF